MSLPADLFAPENFAATRRPIREAATLPPYCYWSPEFYAREVERIFLREWLCVGRAEQIPNPGDFFTVELFGRPLIIVRDKSGRIRAHVNSCRHRGTAIAEGEGHCTAFHCPYHNWTYALSGELLGTPEMEEAIGFDKGQYGLLVVKLETWGGFLFVNFDPTSPPLLTVLGDLPELMRNYRLEEMVCTRRQNYDVACNWKVYVENAMEEYHTPTVHKSQYTDRVPLESWVVEETRGLYEVLYTETTGSLALLGDEGFPPVAGLSRKELVGSYIPYVYPTFIFLISPDTMFYVIVEPRGPEQSVIRMGNCFPASTVARPDFEALAKRYYNRTSITLPQDNNACEWQQRGIRAPVARPGRYSMREQLVHHIANYVLDRVLGRGPIEASGGSVQTWGWRKLSADVVRLDA
jgi:choline monooxygenase